MLNALQLSADFLHECGHSDEVFERLVDFVPRHLVGLVLVLSLVFQTSVGAPPLQNVGVP